MIKLENLKDKSKVVKYENYKNNQDEMILRDHLAIDRTILANERTYLSYMRTVVSFIVAALTLYKLLEGIEGIITAIILCGSAVYLFIRGKRNFTRRGYNIRRDSYTRNWYSLWKWMLGNSLLVI